MDQALTLLSEFFAADAWWNLPVARAVAVVLLAWLAAHLVDFVLVRLILRLTSKSETELDDQVAELLHGPLRSTVLLIGLVIATRFFELPPTATSWTIKILFSLLILIWSLAAFRVSRLLFEAASRPGSKTSLDRRTLPLFDNLAKIIIFGLGVYLALKAWNVDASAWLTSAGIVGIAVGFAAKDTLANLFSGLFIIVDNPYQVGDFVVLGSGERGEVTQVGLRSTRILTRDDVEVTIPNSVISNSTIVNESGGRWERYRVRVKVGVAYGSDIDRVRAVLLDEAAACGELCKDPEPRVRFRAFGDSSLDFELLAWVEKPVERGRVLDMLMSSVYQRFQRENIEIPFPQRDLYVKEMPGEGSTNGAGDE